MKEWLRKAIVDMFQKLETPITSMGTRSKKQLNGMASYLP
jgi:hypothetical protein